MPDSVRAEIGGAGVVEQGSPTAGHEAALLFVTDAPSWSVC